MKHPNPERCRDLGMTFLFLAESSPKAKVHMIDGSFHPCGTSACHAGWFAIARGLKRTFGSKKYNFLSSATDMANFLGFKDWDFLRCWADDFPNLWGNGNGSSMFCDSDAFNCRNEEPTLEEIGIHWLNVADMIEALQ